MRCLEIIVGNYFYKLIAKAGDCSKNYCERSTKKLLCRLFIFLAFESKSSGPYTTKHYSYNQWTVPCDVVHWESTICLNFNICT
jgi:hypothetical protein